jgi:hypothetical protein
MAYTGRAPSAAPLTSGDITDGAVAPVDLSTGAPSWDTSGNLTVDGGAVFNEAGADVDFRVESDTNANALFLEGSSGNVGIGTSSPSGNLEIATSAADTGVDLVLDGNKTSNGGIGSIIFNNNGDSVGMIRSNRASANDAADMLFYTQATGGTNTERMRIDSSGNLLVGKTTSGTQNTADGFELRQAGYLFVTKSSDTVAYFNRRTSDGDIVLFRKDNSTVGSIGVASGDQLFIGRASGSQGIKFKNAGVIPCNADGSDSDNDQDLGISSVRWDDIYATNGTIQTSDRNEKQDIEELSEAEQRVAVAAKGLLRKFRWKDAVAEKGDDARIHFGIIAQDLQDAFAAEGLDAGRYAMFISSTWWETQTEVPAVEAVEAQDAVYDDEGNLVSEAVEAVEAKEAYTRTDTYDTAEEAPEGATERTRLGVRYPELLAFIIAAI